MDAKIAEFTALLRRNGLRVSMAEQLDAFHALQRMGLAARPTFKDTLRATMVKRAIDVPVYDDLFDLHFSGLADAIHDAADSLRSSMDLSEADFQALIERLAEILADLHIELSPLAEALLRDDGGRLEQMLRRAAAQANAPGIERPYQEGRYSHGTAQSLGLGALAEEIDPRTWPRCCSASSNAASRICAT
jgi:uncharacterized protein with von Willebrand factor type A (vWA) domain